MSSSPLAQSADKQVLFARLGLNEQVHKMLLDDAQKARDTLSRNSLNLTEQSQNNSLIRVPYKWDELSETAKHREILTIVHNATTHTRPYYAMGRYQTSVNEENWVARWYLWHTFRYRDNRDTRNRAQADTVNPGYQGAHVGHTRGSGGGNFWDPVHNIYR